MGKSAACTPRYLIYTMSGERAVRTYLVRDGGVMSDENLVYILTLPGSWSCGCPQLYLDPKPAKTGALSSPMPLAAGSG
jgi:hypothetical protein